MIIQFVYTEADTPGPFKSERGFKFSSVAVPNDFSTAGLDERAIIQSNQDKLNSVLADYMSYRAPQVDVFMTDEDFDNLPKDYCFTTGPLGTFAIGRLFTCGTKNGRPGTPFHQGFIFDSVDRLALTEAVNSKAFGVLPRPIDFAFSSNWRNARGDEAVNQFEIDAYSFPYPELRQGHLSSLQHIAFESATNPLALIAQFGQSVYDGQNFLFPAQFNLRFAEWVSLLTHLVPQSVAWQFCFSSLPASKSRVDFFPRIESVQSPASAQVNSAVATWADVANHAFEHDIDIELLTLIDLVSISFVPPSMLNPEGKFRSSLSVALLAYLFMDESFFEEEATDLADRLILALEDVGFPSAFKSKEAKSEFIGYVERQNRLLSHATKYDTFIQRLTALQVR